MQYVNRNLNERTENRTGVKIGDFGTGGRVYHNTVRVERGSEVPHHRARCRPAACGPPFCRASLCQE